ncbi:MAG TPA: membrane protein insertion efficiency factor YidD [Ignavibacteriaceae bacterium]
MKKIFFLLLVSSSFLFAQSDIVKWGKADITYEKQDIYQKRNYSFESENAGEFLAKSFTNAYWFFISDVDGDNCPFRPSCSSFMLEAVKETNIFQASLIFFDRFTRDMNLFKGKNHYARVKSGHYFDPAINYTLNSGKINYVSAGTVVDD